MPRISSMPPRFRLSLRETPDFAAIWRVSPLRVEAQTVGTSVQRLHDGDVGDAAALAHRLQAEALAAAVERMNERGHQLCARRAQWMAQGDRPAVNVEAGGIRSELLHPGERDWGERLVDLVQVELVHASARTFERDARRADRLVEHDDGIAGG